MEIESDSIDNLCKKNNLDKLYNDNSLKRKKINELKNEIKKMKTKIYENTEKIQKLCEHKWETIIVYGDPTSYECIKCGVWRRR
jgi:uncharacterized protein (UPF0218 family)